MITNTRVIQVLAGLLAACLGLVASPATSQAQPAVASASRAAQYVLLIDDSGSMRPIGRDKGADPDRLAVFATRSVLALLDDSDEVSVVRLNAVADQETPAPIRPLREVRAEIETSLSDSAPISQYAGKWTPCNQALDAVRARLNEARRPGVRQVLIYLTDGACESAGRPESVNPEAFLKGLDSASEGFLFYLLRFKGRAYTQALDKLATRTGGASFELTNAATGILGPFARALSQAQGFDAFEVTPQNQQFPAHTAAKRVRLLAVAEGNGSPLTFDFGATTPALLGETRAGVHQFPGQRAYRYVAVDYRPGDRPVSIAVKNAGPDWKVVAIPEYRLKLATSVRAGPCGSNGSSVQSVEIGSTACVMVDLVDESGLPVSASTFGSRVDLAVDYQAPGAASSQALPLNVTGSSIAGTLERAQLNPGDHVFRPRALVHIGTGAPMALAGLAMTLQATSARIASSLDRWDAGALVPGEFKDSEFTLSGNFSRTDGTFRVERSDELPACIRLTMSGTEVGGSVSLVDGQKYRLGIRAQGLCALETTKRSISTTVRIEAPGLPALEIPVSGTLDVQVELPPSLEVAVKRGEPLRVEVPIRSNHRGEAPLSLERIEKADELPGDDLQVGFKTTADVDTPGTRLASKGDFSLDSGKGSATGPAFWIEANACCAAGRFGTSIEVKLPNESQGYRIPVTLVLDSGDWWECHKQQVYWTAAAFLALLSALALRNMWRYTLFIRLEPLDTVFPTVWRMNVDGLKPCEGKIKRKPSVTHRLLHWLVNGGLSTAFGRKYHETMRADVRFGNSLTEWFLKLDKPEWRSRGSGPPEILGRGKQDAFYVVAVRKKGVNPNALHFWKREGARFVTVGSTNYGGSEEFEFALAAESGNSSGSEASWTSVPIDGTGERFVKPGRTEANASNGDIIYMKRR
jgi:Mg-chelatase subunit ChlD